MRIGLDVTALCALQSGVGTYTANLLEQLCERPDDEILPLAHRPARGGPVRPIYPRTASVNKTAWMQLLLPWQLMRLKVDVCHFTNNVASVFTPCPSVLTLHDMTLWLFPEHHSRRRLAAMRPVIPLAAQRAAAIITVSHSAKKDIIRILGVAEDKVHVVYEAADASFRPLPAGPRLEEARRCYDLPERFLLYVGTIEPRKNLVRLLESFALLRKDIGPRHTLVLAGQRGWKAEGVFEAVRRLDLGGAVRFLDFVPKDTLVCLYNLAEALVFPSLYEGFGLPVVEAMACGTPVVTSPRGSLAEVASGAAELVDPNEIEDIARGLKSVLTDPARRESLRRMGLVRSARFSWADAAEQTRRVYTQALRLQQPLPQPALRP